MLLFERPGWDEDAYAVWSNAMAKKSVILCVPTKWHGHTVLRLAFVNPDTQSARVIEVLATLRRHRISTQDTKVARLIRSHAMSW